MRREAVNRIVEDIRRKFAANSGLGNVGRPVDQTKMPLVTVWPKIKCSTIKPSQSRSNSAQ